MARRIFSGILIFLSSLFLMASVLGLGLVWVYNEPLTREAVARLTTADNELVSAQTSIRGARAELERVTRIVDAAELPSENFLVHLLPDRNARILIYCNNNFANAPGPFPTKVASASLNLSTYVALYTYGYRNVFELGPFVDLKESKLPEAAEHFRAAGFKDGLLDVAAGRPMQFVADPVGSIASLVRHAFKLHADFKRRWQAIPGFNLDEVRVILAESIFRLNLDGGREPCLHPFERLLYRWQVLQLVMAATERTLYSCFK